MHHLQGAKDIALATGICPKEQGYREATYARLTLYQGCFVRETWGGQQTEDLTLFDRPLVGYGKVVKHSSCLYL